MLTSSTSATCSDLLKGHPVLRFTLITISCLLCSGIVFGGGLLVQIFAGAGIGSWLCDPGQKVCDAQFLFVSQAFNSAGGVAMIPQFIAGLIFDRAGGRVLGSLGACLVALGLLALQVPLLGVQHGYDEQTSGVLFWSLLIAGIGASAVLFVPMTMVWHLPDRQSLVAASAASIIPVAALLPILLSALMHWTGASLSSAMWVWLVLAVTSAVFFWCAVPTLSEYRAEAEEVLGTALPPADPAWKTVKDGITVLSQHWPLHLLLIVELAVGTTLIALYTSLLGDWGMLMFGSSSAGKELGTIYNLMSGIGGVFLTPLLAYIGDNLEHGTPLLLVAMAMPTFVASVTIGLPTWSAQVATCAAFALSVTFQGTLATKYVLAFAGPTLLGTVYGLITVVLAPIFLALQAFEYGWMLLLPAEGLLHLRLPLQATCIFQAICLAVWSARLIYTGLPERPVMLAHPKEALPLLGPRTES